MSDLRALGEQKEVSSPRARSATASAAPASRSCSCTARSSTRDLWRKVVPALAKDFRCITPDLPLGSHERADAARTPTSRPPALAKLIADFIAALDLENVTLVGNDTGGALCQIVVTRAPRAHRPPRADALRRVRRSSRRACSSSCSGVARIPGCVFGLAQSHADPPRCADSPIAFGWLTKRASRARGHRRIRAAGACGRRRPARHRQVPQGVSPSYTQEAAHAASRSSTSRS